jgi:hypothetical protein
MTALKILCIAIPLALLSANVEADSGAPTKAQIAAIQSAVKARLKDGDSAKFAEIRLGKSNAGATVACGVVNAKNGYGGYIGYQAFMVQLDSSEAWVRELDDPTRYAQAKAECHMIGIDLKLATG